MTENTLDTPTLVTCGLPYANGDLHIGHLRGLIAGDLYTRAVRRAGGTAAYVSGSDVHGTPIALAAEKEGDDPRSFALRYHEQFQNQFPKLDIHLDAYGHTDTEQNHQTTNSLVQSLNNSGAYLEQDVNVAVDTETGDVLPDRYVQGDCPRCGEQARGDECETCGRHLEPGDVNNPVSTRTGASARYEKRRHGFINLPAYEETIQLFLQEVSGSPQVTQRTQEWLDTGLRPWCITRDLDWGVPDPTYESRVLYVWIDALSEYVSATKQYSKQENPSFNWTDVWMGDGDVVHVIGKDIIQHHTTLWPALLNSADLSLPTAILASGFVTLDGQALSTSRGHAVWASDYTNRGYSPAYLRYLLTGAANLEHDVDFTWSDLASHANNDLVNTAGNFLYRIASLGSDESIVDTTPSEAVQTYIETAVNDYVRAVERYDIRDIATAPIKLARYGNKYLQQTEPWNTTGDAKQQAIAYAAYIARTVLALLQPVAPSEVQGIWDGFYTSISSDDITLKQIPLTGQLSGIEPPFEPVEEKQYPNLTS